jgi:TonB family protein
MSTHALDGGLRPALPPTLQPMALALAAPRTDKRTALFASGVVYLLIPAALMALSRVIPVRPPVVPPTTGGETIYVPTTVGSISLGGGQPAPARREVNESQTLPEFTHPALSDLANMQTPNLLPSNATLGASSTGPSGPAGADSPTSGNRGPVGPVGPAGPGEGPVLNIASDAVRILHQTVPPYPAVARAVKQQGDVVVRMFIDTHGVPTSVQVEEGPNLLRAAAEAAAKQWRFTPAQVNGQAVPATFLLTLKFRLQ